MSFSDKYCFAGDLFAQIKNLQKRGVVNKTIDILFKFYGSKHYLANNQFEINDKDPGTFQHYERS